jgi:protein involved in polysaccharide export with SLBB domain
MVFASVGQMLPIYGAKLFLQSPSTFAPVDQAPVTDTYVIGPGDQLLVRICGQTNFNADLTVDRNGIIYLPQVGAIQVGGIKYGDVQRQIHDSIARIYKNFSLSVNIGQLHPIRIFVIGQARYPGSYTVSSASTLVSAIFATGGPGPQGSLRHIQLRRDGTNVVDFDMYDLLVNGDKSHDVPLLPGDVIYIPPVGAQVAVYGSVKNPGIYELKDGERKSDAAAGKSSNVALGRAASGTVADILADAGGLTSMASLSRASLERIDPQQHQRALDLALDPAGRSTPMQDGDILRVLPIAPTFDQTVTVRGNLADPGRFQWHKGMKLSELLPSNEALVTRDYWQKRNQLGLPSPVFEPDYAQRFTAYRRAQAESQRQYFLYLQREQERKLYDQQTQNTSAQGTASTPGQPPPMDVNAQAAQSNDMVYGNSTGPLNPPDEQQPGTVPDQPAQSTATNPQRSNTLGGASLAEQQRTTRTENTAMARNVIDVSLPVPEIDWSYAVIERMDPVTLQMKLIPFDLGQLVLQHDASQDLTVEPHDVITIFSQADIRVPQSQQTKLIRVEGEVAHAGIYSAEPGETLRHVIERAGGLTPGAYLFGAQLTRESARIVQQQQLDEYVTQLELGIDRASASTAASALSPQDQAAATASLTSSQTLVTRLRQLRASGRVVLALTADVRGTDKLPDLPLEDGDRFFVPSRPSSVNVVGAVYEQSSFLFQPQRRVFGYLKEAGGATRAADPTHAFVIRADGSVFSRESAKTFWGNEFEQARVHPGDTIVVPEKIYRGNAIRSVLEFSQLFSSLAFGAAALAVITN